VRAGQSRRSRRASSDSPRTIGALHETDRGAARLPAHDGPLVEVRVAASDDDPRPSEQHPREHDETGDDQDEQQVDHEDDRRYDEHDEYDCDRDDGDHRRDREEDPAADVVHPAQEVAGIHDAFPPLRGLRPLTSLLVEAGRVGDVGVLAPSALLEREPDPAWGAGEPPTPDHPLGAVRGDGVVGHRRNVARELRAITGSKTPPTPAR
jgi:hypothetical protein